MKRSYNQKPDIHNPAGKPNSWAPEEGIPREPGLVGILQVSPTGVSRLLVWRSLYFMHKYTMYLLLSQIYYYVFTYYSIKKQIYFKLFTPMKLSTNTPISLIKDDC